MNGMSPTQDLVAHDNMFYLEFGKYSKEAGKHVLEKIDFARKNE